MNDRRNMVTCLILLVVACVMVSCASLIGVGYYLRGSTISEISSITEEISKLPDEAPTQPEPSLETTQDPLHTENSSNTPVDTEIEPNITRQMEEIQLQVIMERGLTPSENIERKIYTSEQLNEKITQDFLKDYPIEDARNEALVLASFGLLTPDFDLHTLYTELYSEQVAGFFDIEMKEMVVVQGDNFGGVERFVYAHEYTHVLQDQNFDIENGLHYNDEDCETETERCSAVLALIEGDATLSQLRWFMSNASPADQAELMEMVTKETDSPVFDSAPEFIALGLTFPYEYGYIFVDHLHSNGGWGTVDRAYQNPPVSTEQILHPDHYPDDKPIPISLPTFDEILGSGWEELDRGVMGEWYTYLILAKGLDERARLDIDQAKLASEGWGGDSYVVYYNPSTDKTVMVLHSTWDSSFDADEFADSFRDYADGRFGTSSSDSWQGADGYHIFHHQADTTTWILAPDAEQAAIIWQTIGP